MARESTVRTTPTTSCCCPPSLDEWLPDAALEVEAKAKAERHRTEDAAEAQAQGRQPRPAPPLRETPDDRTQIQRYGPRVFY